MTADAFSEIRTLATRDDISFSEFDALYTRLVKNGDWAEAVFLTSLMYLCAKKRSDADTPDILALLKTTVEGCTGSESEPKKPNPQF
jgi:hypothetical protein